MGLFGKQSNLSETKCKKCGTELSDPDRLKRHLEKAHGKIKEKCRVCGTEFYTSVYLLIYLTKKK